jgi:hypothetical protein
MYVLMTSAMQRARFSAGHIALAVALFGVAASACTVSSVGTPTIVTEPANVSSSAYDVVRLAGAMEAP